MAEVPSTADVVVVGGGIEGVAAAWALARRGVTDVVVCERATVGSGGTGKSSGVVRCHYGVPSLAAMAVRGLEVLENAVDVLGEDVGFVRTGYVVAVGEGNVEALDANLATQVKLGVDTGRVSASDVASLWPAARLDDFAAFGFEPRGGYGDAYRTAQAFAAAARRDGVRVLQGSPVVEVLVDGTGGAGGGAAGLGSDGSDGSGAGDAGGRVAGVRLASGERIAARRVVVAAGPWSVALLAPLGIDLPVRAHREQIVLVDPAAGPGASDVPVLSDLVSLQYLRAEPGGRVLVGNSDLSRPAPADPDRYADRADPDYLDVVGEKIGHRLPGWPEASVASTYAGCYDVTPDFNPVISLCGVDGLTVAAGFSGHGFKIAPAVGELVADLVVDGTSSHPDVPASDFRLSRFAEGAPLTSPHPYVGAGEMR